MKIVFLDIDGVLNHARTKERLQSYIGIDEGNLRNFVEFIKRARAEEETEVVLTSSWREDVNWDAVENGYKYVYNRLYSAGITLYDITLVTDRKLGNPNRGEEITRWFMEHQDLDISGYVVLDDEHIFEFKEYGLTKRLIRTSWDSAKGEFQEKTYRKGFGYVTKTVLYALQRRG
ncbi:MAG: hypothetical protein K5879_07875 [Lachnospiraceae bacterium]|nr:hypothetical protein [Lachnospiraceae bacterium]